MYTECVRSVETERKKTNEVKRPQKQEKSKVKNSLALMCLRVIEIYILCTFEKVFVASVQVKTLFCFSSAVSLKGAVLFNMAPLTKVLKKDNHAYLAMPYVD